MGMARFGLRNVGRSKVRLAVVVLLIGGPFFLLLAGLALLYGMGVLPLGAHGWSTLSAVLIIGTVTFTCVPEWLLGRYRSSRKSVCPP